MITDILIPDEIFIHHEPFDYTEWQQTLWTNKSVDELFEAAKLQNSEEH